MAASSPKQEIALKAIYKNISNLRVEANIAYSSRRYSSAVLFAILCGEECSKYLLVYCKEHLPIDVFKRRFRHAPKHRVLGVPWHVSGMLSVVHLMHSIDITKFLKQKSDQRTFLNHLFKFSCHQNPQRLAETIIECLRPYDDVNREGRLIEEMNEREADRRSSVYVDLTEDYEIVGSPANIGKPKAEKYLRDMAVAVAAINFVISPRPDIHKYNDDLPRDMRERNRKEVAEFLKKMRSR